MRARLDGRDREILRLAVPALGALVAEPAFLLVDTALVGHLGAEQLAGVGIGTTVIGTVVGLLVFLAYGTTPAVARLLGAGDRPAAIRAGIDGVWLAVVVGAALLVALPLARPVVAAFGAAPEVTEHAATYAGISILGLPAMLVVLAVTGLLRGLQDTRTPLLVAGAGFGANAVLNAVLIYGLDLGIAGSAIGTVLAQWGMAAWLGAIALREARREAVPLGLRLGSLGRTASTGGWLLVRTLSLRVGLVATTVVAAQAGTATLAATQVAFAIFSTLAFALDALAIAGQAMVGRALGADDVAEARAVTRRLQAWGIGFGVVVGVLLLALAWVAGRAFTADPEVLSALPVALALLALAQPIAGFVFVLDGVLIGAGDVRYLAWTGILNVLVYLPLLLLALLPGVDALAVVWAAFSFGYLGARATTLGLRARTGAWLRPGRAR
ncbi:MATE family efflux transporter [Agrococcus sp. SL85]|uniref:MATE family efflux transporter n=1 Tax=Agrococcus sp. SL85 TaxID=2995141 RepID=UPI00226C8B74|nr:MATE family efflux transporter [Agrococcus sp. SL85]WAC67100.1 MATE family efflux transporter [Agrococcus sp. SL85]